MAARLLRRTLLALALLCGALPLSRARAEPTPPVPVRVGYFKGSALAAQIALGEGDFAREGLDVHLVPLQSGPAILMAAAQGSIDIAYGDTFAFASAIRNGFTNLKLITPANGIVGWLVTAPGRRIATAQDLAGKRVGVTPTPFPAALVRSWAAQNGADPNSIRFSTVPIGGQVAALRTGDLDAVFSFEFLTTRRLQQAGGTVLADIRSGGPAEAPAANYYASDAFISAHPDAVRVFVALVRKAAVQFEVASREEKVRLQGAAFGLDYQALNKEIPGLLDTPDWGGIMTGAINPAAAQAWVDIGVREMAIAGPVDIGPYLFWTATTNNLVAPPKPR
jgi:ABC-type nitrate/sulfonate/bicarbonate transport system substrate-binding protein